jgi:hypothetical protein
MATHPSAWNAYICVVLYFVLRNTATSLTKRGKGTEKTEISIRERERERERDIGRDLARIVCMWCTVKSRQL